MVQVKITTVSFNKKPSSYFPDVIRNQSDVSFLFNESHKCITTARKGVANLVALYQDLMTLQTLLVT